MLTNLINILTYAIKQQKMALFYQCQMLGQFWNLIVKYKLQRPFIVYADTECSLVKTSDPNNIHKHDVNSCCYYFVCTFDTTRNYIRSFVGNNCIVEMIEELDKLSEKCILEMQHNERMVLTWR